MEPNSNPILRPFRTEPNEPKKFDNRARTVPNYQVEPNGTRTVGSLPQLLRSTSEKIANAMQAESGYLVVYWCDSFAHFTVALNSYVLDWISSVHQASFNYNCDQTKSEVANP